MTATPTLKAFEPFKWAVIRLAAYAPNESMPPRLLFASVSLHTNERPRPRCGVTTDRFPVNSGGSVLFRRTVLARDEAIAWYRSTTSGAWMAPLPSEPNERDRDTDGQPIAVSDLLDNPAWPTLGVPTGSDLLLSSYGAGDPAPFIGSGAAPARVHRRLGSNAGLTAVLDDPEAVGFLARRLHLDLVNYTEYLGAIVLVVPNPILRSVANFIVPATDNEPERLVFRLVPRRKQTIEGLSLTFFERRANLLSRFETLPIPADGLVILDQRAPVGASGYVLAHPEHGVLVHQPPLYFIRSIRVTTQVLGAVSSQKVSTEIGESVPTPSLSRVIEAEMHRENRAQALRYDQLWIDGGNRDQTLQLVRARIFRAQKRVMIAGPFLGSPPFLDFLAMFPKTDVPVTFLVSDSTSANLVTKDSSTDSSLPLDAALEGEKYLEPATAHTRARQFSERLGKLVNQGVTGPISLIIADARSASSDAFLVVDSSVWYLGGLLTTGGTGGSMMLMLPDGEPVIARLERIGMQGTHTRIRDPQVDPGR